mgnify:CR=1 FL=1
MSAEIHPLPSDGPGLGERSVYLDAYLAPFRRWLDQDTITEIMVNRPGEVWIEDAADPGMKRIETPEIDDALVLGRIGRLHPRRAHGRGVERNERAGHRVERAGVDRAVDAVSRYRRTGIEIGRAHV